MLEELPQRHSPHRGSRYDRIGRGYGAARREDPLIAAAVGRGLGTARSVVNVGAGTGSYEPRGREVTAVEPSAVMIAQRPAGSAPVIQASAEALPLGDDSFDAAMAIFSDHHWEDRAAGMRELRRVARERVVLINADPALIGDFWLARDYLPGFARIAPEPYREHGDLGGRAAGAVGRGRDRADRDLGGLPRRLLRVLVAAARGLLRRVGAGRDLGLPDAAGGRGA